MANLPRRGEGLVPRREQPLPALPRTDGLPFDVSPPRRGCAKTWRALLAEALAWHSPEEPLTNRRGRTVRWVLDMRIPLLRGETARFLGTLLAEELRSQGATAIAGHSLAGALTVAAVLAAAPEFDGCIVRKRAKGDGRRRLVEGPRPASVVLLDDVLNGGRSAQAAVEALGDERIAISAVLVAVRFGWGDGLRSLAEAGLRVDHLVRLDCLE